MQLLKKIVSDVDVPLLVDKTAATLTSTKRPRANKRCTENEGR
jgi:hypothetical protein